MANYLRSKYLSRVLSSTYILSISKEEIGELDYFREKVYSFDAIFGINKKPPAIETTHVSYVKLAEKLENGFKNADSAVSLTAK